MPTADRKPRARRKRAESDIKSFEAMRRVVLDTQGDDEAWGCVRLGVLRYLAATIKDRDHAPAIADAFHRKPIFMPMARPLHAQD